MLGTKNRVIVEIRKNILMFRKLVNLQRYLQCGFGTACKVRDALVALCVIETMEEASRKYRRVKNKKLLFFYMAYGIINLISLLMCFAGG